MLIELSNKRVSRAVGVEAGPSLKHGNGNNTQAALSGTGGLQREGLVGGSWREPRREGLIAGLMGGRVGDEEAGTEGPDQPGQQRPQQRGNPDW